MLRKNARPAPQADPIRHYTSIKQEEELARNMQHIHAHSSNLMDLVAELTDYSLKMRRNMMQEKEET